MMESQKYAIVDLETTGHSPSSGDRMIQIAIVIMKDWCIEKTFTSFIHPGKPIPLFIQDLTHITDQDVQDALPFEAHAENIYELLQDAIFVAHNTDFDLPFLQSEFKRAGLPKWKGKKIDTVELSKILFPMSLSYKLGDLAADLNIQLEQAHRADDDATATAMLLKKCWEELLILPQTTLEQLHKKSFRLKSNLSQLFFEALQVKRTKVSEDSEFIYYQKLALKKKKIHEKQPQSEVIYPKSINEKRALLQKSIAHFEERPQQFQMMDAVWDNLNENKELVIEASTGIGKTIGYLLPSIIYAKQNNSKVCISTYTTYLLEQLLHGEIPKIERILGSSVKVSLLKGMQNYIDVPLFEQILKMKDVSYDELLTILQVLVWLTKTITGDLNELNVSGGGQLFLDKIRKNPDRSNQIHHEIDFYEHAINESKDADIIVTNHSMLLADLIRHEPIFQHVSGWIIDEAHQFIQAATHREEAIFSYTNWKYVFGQIGLSTDNQVFSMFYQAALKTNRVSMKILNELEKRYIQLLQKFEDVIQQIAHQMKKSFSKSKFDLKQTVFLKDLYVDKALAASLSNDMQKWIDLAEEVSKNFEQQVDELSKEHLILIEQWQYWIREYKIKVVEWDEIFISEDDHFLKWVEMDRRNIPGSIQIYKRPINVKETVQQLFSTIRKKSGLIWTSGTLTVPNNERFITEQLGIQKEVSILKLIAPPSYYSGANAYIVSDMPDIQAVSQSDYIESVALAITRIVRTTQGRCFVLFTSKDMLRKTLELIQESELLDDYMLFGQGVTSGSRMRLLKSFQKFSHSVLFGTNSFWEGVDVPGDGLSSVIIVRLPFTAPEEPTFKAKCQELQEQGLNAFTELSLPEAILRFKQGFGRLIRSSQDKGAFIVLDRRIDTKSYGKEFLRALPPISIQKLPLSDMVLELEDWYNNKDEERKQVGKNEK